MESTVQSLLFYDVVSCSGYVVLKDIRTIVKSVQIRLTDVR